MAQIQFALLEVHHVFVPYFRLGADLTGARCDLSYLQLVHAFGDYVCPTRCSLAHLKHEATVTSCRLEVLLLKLRGGAATECCWHAYALTDDDFMVSVT